MLLDWSSWVELGSAEAINKAGRLGFRVTLRTKANHDHNSQGTINEDRLWGNKLEEFVWHAR